MIWLVAIGLGIWCWLQHQKLGELSRDLLDLRGDLQRLSESGFRPADSVDKATFVGQEPIEAPLAQAFEPSPLAAAAVGVASAPIKDIFAPRSMPPGRGTLPAAAEAEPAIATANTQPGRTRSDWLSENGLAWIGGGALALGGLMLVAYAAQRGLFTPGFRILTALVIGVVALCIGEWLRRKTRAEDEAPQLVPALTTAAGAAILYAAIWAANVLYHFIPTPLTAVLLASISLGLLSLALHYGEALGILAILGAMAVPIVSGGMFWKGGPLDAYLILITATGMASAGLHRWRRVGMVTLTAIALWTMERLISEDSRGVAMLASTIAVLALGAAWIERRKAEDDKSALPPLPNIALAGVAAFGLLLWIAPPSAFPSTYAVLTTLILTTVVAAGIRLGLLAPKMLSLPAVIVALIAGLTLAKSMNGSSPLDPSRTSWLLVAIAAVAAAGLFAAMRAPAPRTTAMIGAGVAALSLTLLGQPLAQFLPHYAIAIDLGFAALLAIGALVLARTSPDARTDLSLAAWVGASAEAVGLALHAGTDGRLAPSAYGLLAIALAALAFRIRWRGFAEAAVIACLASLAALLGPNEAGAAFTGHASWLTVAAIAVGGVLTQGVAWWLLRQRGDVPTSTEASSTLAIVSALLGAFLVVQCWSTPVGSRLVLGVFEAASLRTILMLSAGLTLAVRGAATPIGRWRAPVILTLAALHGLVLEGLVLHPWWGNPAAIIGPPIADSLLLGLLAPALVLAIAGWRLVRSHKTAAAIAIATGLIFLGLWIVSEVRRLFHGQVLSVGAMGYAECAAYALAFLTVAGGLGAVRTGLQRLLRSTGSVATAVSGITWATLAWSAVTFANLASPWWGPLDGELRTPLLLLVLYVLGIAGSGWIARQARISNQAMLAKAALSVTAVEGFSLLTLAIRYGFHGAAMRAPLREASLETWTFSALWALYGLGLLSAGAARKDVPLRVLGLTILLVTTAKVFLFDMATLEGVVRAASFLALGAVLLFGAFTARRLRGRPLPTTPKTPKTTP